MWYEDFHNRTEVMGMYGRSINRIKIEIGAKVIEQVSDFIDIGNLISELKEDIYTYLWS
jgi:hypothetical protein